MTAMEKFHNDLEAHKGQEKLVIKPKLYSLLKSLDELQDKFINAFNKPRVDWDSSQIDPRNLVAPSYFAPFLLNVKDFNKALHAVTTESEDMTTSTSTKKDTGCVIDGAYFINAMNVATELYFFETYYLSYLPNYIAIGNLYSVTKAKGILAKYVKILKQIYSISSYNPKFSKFDTFCIKTDKIFNFKEVTPEKFLDKPVSK